MRACMHVHPEFFISRDRPVYNGLKFDDQCTHFFIDHFLEYIFFACEMHVNGSAAFSRGLGNISHGCLVEPKTFEHFACGFQYMFFCGHEKGYALSVAQI